MAASRRRWMMVVAVLFLAMAVAEAVNMIFFDGGVASIRPLVLFSVTGILWFVMYRRRVSIKDSGPGSRPMRILILLLLAAVWGYFADLRNGEIGSFIVRLILFPLMVELVVSWLREKGTGEQAD